MGLKVLNVIQQEAYEHMIKSDQNGIESRFMNLAASEYVRR